MGSVKLVQVDWIDPWSHSGWVETGDLESAAKRDLGCSTVGWLVKETEDRLVLAGSRVSTENGLGDLFVIPRRVIDRVIVLRPK